MHSQTDNSFDYVWSINVLEHVTPIRPYLEEIFRVLKPGGIFWGRCMCCWRTAHHTHCVPSTGTTPTGTLRAGTTFTWTW